MSPGFLIALGFLAQGFLLAWLSLLLLACMYDIATLNMVD